MSPAPGQRRDWDGHCLALILITSVFFGCALYALIWWLGQK